MLYRKSFQLFSSGSRPPNRLLGPLPPVNVAVRPARFSHALTKCCYLQSKPKEKSSSAARQLINTLNVNVHGDLIHADWDSLELSCAAKALLQQHGVKASTALKLHRVLGFEDVDDIQRLSPELVSQLKLKPLQLEPLLGMLQACQTAQGRHPAQHLQPAPRQGLIKKPLELEGVAYLAFSSDGRRALSTNKAHELEVWDLAAGARVATLQGHEDFIWTASFTPDGRKAVSGGAGGAARVWDLCTNTYITLEGHSSVVAALAIAPDGRRALSGSHDGTLCLWDLDACECLDTLEAGGSGINSAAITPDGRYAVTGCEDGTLQVWDLVTHACTATIDRQGGEVFDVAITPDGRHMVSGHVDKMVRVWDLEARSCSATLLGHTDQVVCVAITPDGRYAVTGGEDATLRVWDLATYTCAATLAEGRWEPEDKTWAVVITPDGRWAITC